MKRPAVLARRGNGNSRRAYRRAKPYFKGVTLKILALLAEQDMTCEELARKLGKYPNQISGRFRPLAEAKKIKKVGTRETHTGCAADLWRVTTHGRQMSIL
jgi:hypothetical protein